jgi:hypothetical protein
LLRFLPGLPGGNSWRRESRNHTAFLPRREGAKFRRDLLPGALGDHGGIRQLYLRPAKTVWLWHAFDREKFLFLFNVGWSRLDKRVLAHLAASA